MTEQETAGGQDSRRRGCFRVCYTLVLFALLLVAAAVAAVWTGVPQERGVPWLVERWTGARLDWSVEQLAPPLRLERLALYDMVGAEKPPVLEVTGFEAGYRLSPCASRQFPRVNAESVSVRVDGTDAEDTNYDFLLRRLGAPGAEGAAQAGTPDARWMPREAHIGKITAEAAFADWALRLAGAAMHLYAESAEDFALTVEGDEVAAEWRADMLGIVSRSATGALAGRVKRTPDQASFEMRGNLEPLAAFEGSGYLSLDGPQTFSLDVRRLQFDEGPWGGMLARYSPLPVAFESLRLAPLEIQGEGVLAAATLTRANAELQAAGLALGAEGAWYAGDVGLRVKGAPEAADGFDATLSLNRGQQIGIRVRGPFSTPAMRWQLSGWSREDLEAVVPPKYRDWLSLAPALERLEASGSLGVESRGYQLDVEVRPGFNEAGEVRLAAEGAGMLPEVLARLMASSSEAGSTAAPERLFEAKVDATWQSQEIAAQLAATAEGAQEIVLALKQVEPMEWAGLIGLKPPLRGLGMRLQGTAALQMPPEGAYALETELEARGIRFGEALLFGTRTIHITGDAALARDISTVQVSALKLDVDEDTGAEASAVEVDLGTGVGRAELGMRVNLMPLAPLFGLPELWGRVQASGPVEWDTEHVHGEWSAEATTLGYGDWSIPYGVPLKTAGTAEAALDMSAVSARNVSFSLGEATKGQLAEAVWTGGEPGGMVLRDLRLETDWVPAVAKGFLDAATGSGAVSVESFHWAGARMESTGNCTLALEEAVLPDAVALLGELAAEVRFEVRTENETLVLEAGGQVKAASLETGGIVLRGLEGAVRGEGGRLRIENLTSDLLGGRLVAVVEAGVLEPGLPVRMAADLHEIDLAVFTEEFKPPQVVLTGQVSGNAEVRLHPAGLDDFKAHLKADKGITLNRGMVEQILLSQQVSGVAGGKTLSKVVQKVIGEGEQRPFDRASMDLGMEDGRITGQAVLESERLNLTIDIKADPEALLEALRIREQQAAGAR